MIKAQGGIFVRLPDRNRCSMRIAGSNDQRHDAISDQSQPRGARDDDHDIDNRFRPILWAPGDWNAFFGFGTNILVTCWC